MIRAGQPGDHASGPRSAPGEADDDRARTPTGDRRAAGRVRPRGRAGGAAHRRRARRSRRRALRTPRCTSTCCTATSWCWRRSPAAIPSTPGSPVGKGVCGTAVATGAGPERARRAGDRELHRVQHLDPLGAGGADPPRRQDPGPDRRGQRRARSVHAGGGGGGAAGGGRDRSSACEGGDSSRQALSHSRRRALRRRVGNGPARRRPPRRPGRPPRLSSARLRCPGRRPRADLLRPARRRPIAGRAGTCRSAGRSRSPTSRRCANLGARAADHRRLLLGRAAGAALRAGASRPGRAPGAGLARPGVARRAGGVRGPFRRAQPRPTFQEARRALRESGLRERDPGRVPASASSSCRSRPISTTPSGPASSRRSGSPAGPSRKCGPAWATSTSETASRRSAASPPSCSTAKTIPSRSRPRATTAQLLGADFHPVPHCGHVRYVEAHEEFARVVGGFLAA